MKARLLLLVFLAGLCSLITSCGDINRTVNSHTLPRPSDAGIIEWLTGQQITFDKLWGIPLSGWTVEKGEVSTLEVISVSQNPADQVLAADLKFTVLARGRGAHITGILRYRLLENHHLQYVDFTSTGAQKFGNW